MSNNQSQGQNAPTKQMTASIVEKYGDPNNPREHWTDVGRAFQHKDGKGWNLQIRPGLSVGSTTIVLREPKEKEDAGADAPGEESFP